MTGEVAGMTGEVQRGFSGEALDSRLRGNDEWGDGSSVIPA